MNEINYPLTTTYFIAKNGVVSYGVIEPDQCMTTGLPELEQFTDKELWIVRLHELGILEQELIDAGYLPQPSITP